MLQPNLAPHSYSYNPTPKPNTSTNPFFLLTDPPIKGTKNWIEYNSLDHHPTNFNMKFSSVQFTETSIEYRVSSNLKRHTSHISGLLDLALKVLTLDQVGDIILLIIILLLTLGLLHVLVGLGELAEGGEAVGAKLVEDTGDELGEFLLLAVAVEGEGVGRDGGVDWLGVGC
jgi:hypothetical protein